MYREPEANRETDRDPQKVGRRLIDCPDVLHLRTGDARRDDDQNEDENRPHCQSAKPYRPGRLAPGGPLRLVHSELACVNGALFPDIYSSIPASASMRPALNV